VSDSAGVLFQVTGLSDREVGDAVDGIAGVGL
jgi:hypothetical protein